MRKQEQSDGMASLTWQEATELRFKRWFLPRGAIDIDMTGSAGTGLGAWRVPDKWDPGLQAPWTYAIWMMLLTAQFSALKTVPGAQEASDHRFWLTQYILYFWHNCQLLRRACLVWTLGFAIY